MTENTSAQVARKQDRPFFLWVLTIADGLVCGLLPMVAILFLFHNSEAGITVLELIVIVFLSGGIMATSIGTLYRDNFSRYTLLALITIYWSFRFYNAINTINAEAVNRDNFGHVYGDL